MDAVIDQEPPDPSALVCARCGAVAGDARWCAGCGLNLHSQPELPTAEEFAAKRREEEWLRQHGAAAAESPHGVAPGPLEFSPSTLAGWWTRVGASVIDTLILV